MARAAAVMILVERDGTPRALLAVGRFSRHMMRVMLMDRVDVHVLVAVVVAMMVIRPTDMMACTTAALQCHKLQRSQEASQS